MTDEQMEIDRLEAKYEEVKADLKKALEVAANTLLAYKARAEKAEAELAELWNKLLKSVEMKPRQQSEYIAGLVGTELERQARQLRGESK